MPRPAGFALELPRSFHATLPSSEAEELPQFIEIPAEPAPQPGFKITAETLEAANLPYLSQLLGLSAVPVRLEIPAGKQTEPRSVFTDRAPTQWAFDVKWSPRLALSVALNVAGFFIFPLKIANLAKAGVIAGIALADNWDSLSQINLDHIADCFKNNPKETLIGCALILGGGTLATILAPNAAPKAFNLIFNGFLALNHGQRSIASANEKLVTAALRQETISTRDLKALSKKKAELHYELGGYLGEMGLILFCSSVAKGIEMVIPKLGIHPKFKPETIGNLACMPDDFIPSGRNLYEWTQRLGSNPA